MSSLEPLALEKLICRLDKLEGCEARQFVSPVTGCLFVTARMWSAPDAEGRRNPVCDISFSIPIGISDVSRDMALKTLLTWEQLVLVPCIDALYFRGGK